MKTIQRIYIAILLLIFISCKSELPVVVIPDYGDNGLLTETFPLNDFVKSSMEGVYNVVEGQSDFGKSVVVMWNGNHLSIFTGKNASYMVFQGGSLDSVLIFEGYWRFATGAETGMVTLYIKRKDGGRELISGKEPEKITFRGLFGKETSKPETPLVLEFSHKFNKPNEDYWIIGHRGGGRNSDRLQASENSLEMIQLAERLGANSIEIDIKLTKDKIPVLFHDENLSLRLINESYFIGSISNYTFAQLRTFCTLKYGGKIPTLDEALDVVLEKTNLKLVWLDIKSSGLIETVAKVQEKYLEKAELMGRDLEILIGLPTEEAIDEYLKFEGHENAPAICELSLNDVRKTNAVIWAPRWSLGLQNSEIEQMHSEGRRAFVWTLDEAKFIKIYQRDGIFDGILSNYPSIVAYEYYSK